MASLEILAAAAVAVAAIPVAVQAQAAPAKPATAAAGKLVFMRCAACHSVTPDGPAKVGPNLGKVFGRKSGSLEGYRYSPAMAATKMVWNEATLDKWLTRPAGLVPGTSMVFAGLPKPEDRAAVIAYLKKPAP